jgi:hypothetical protein
MSAYTHAEDWCLPVGGILYQSIRPLSWEVGVLTTEDRPGSGMILTVPAGTVFDVSIPVGLRWLFDPHDPHYLKAAALHDEMLKRGWARTTAGAEFHEALKADKVARWRRLAMWLAVSLFKYR